MSYLVAFDYENDELALFEDWDDDFEYFYEAEKNEAGILDGHVELHPNVVYLETGMASVDTLIPF